MPSTRLFTLPKEINGSKFTAVFFPNLLVRENGTGRTISMPPAAYVANTFIRKFQGGDPYAVVANMDGIIRDWGNGSGGQLMGVEYDVDTEDRNYLEPMGVNSIIRENNTGLIKVYANVTAFQDYKSDFNKLHVRENLNTLEIACDAALKEFNFKYNTPQVRAQVVSKLTPIFEAMKQSQALYAYKLTCDTSNNTEDIIDNDMLLVDAEVAMSRAMEKIVQRFTLRKRSDMSAE
jgi:phage tail sheath protein FI